MHAVIHATMHAALHDVIHAGMYAVRYAAINTFFTTRNMILKNSQFRTTVTHLPLFSLHQLREIS